MTAPHPGSGQPRRLDAGVLEPEIGSFRLHLAAEGKSPKTIRTYTDAARWFAAEHMLGQAGKTAWAQADRRDIQEWMEWLLARGSDSYASSQFRALQQFFKWLAVEEDLPSPVTRLRPPRVADKPVPVFAAREMAGIEGACTGRGFTQRRDAAIIAVLKAVGIRLSELAGIRYDPHDPRRSDIDLMEREITVHGKGRKTRTVKISYDAARTIDRYLRVRAKHAQARRPQLWLGANGRGPLTASGIYQAVRRRAAQCGVDAWLHRFRHHFSHAWLDRGGPEGDLMELNGWSPPQMLRRCRASARAASARRTCDRIMEDDL